MSVVYHCTVCGGTRVNISRWVSVNTGRPDEEQDGPVDHFWCPDCEADGIEPVHGGICDGDDIDHCTPCQLGRVNGAVRALGPVEPFAIVIRGNAREVRSQIEYVPVGSVVTWYDVTGYESQTMARTRSGTWAGRDGADHTTHKVAVRLEQEARHRPGFTLFVCPGGPRG